MYKARGTLTLISLDEAQHQKFNYFSNLQDDWFTFSIVAQEHFKFSRESSRWTHE
jgi:hypothetical protein